MMEGERANFNTVNPEPLRDPTEYPPVGASIGCMDIEGRIGTLGGYIVADGTVYALTNHHVVFGTDRREPFPSLMEIPDSIIIHQPPKGDLDREIKSGEYSIVDMEDLLERFTGTEKGKIYEIQLKLLKDRLTMLKEWCDKPSALGTVTRSSGLSVNPVLSINPVLERRRDWAVIKAGDDDRGTADTTKFINEASVLNPNST